MGFECMTHSLLVERNGINSWCVFKPWSSLTMMIQTKAYIFRGSGLGHDYLRQFLGSVHEYLISF